MRLTDVLIAWGRIDAEKVASAVHAHRRWGKRIGRVLVELGFCSRADVVNALAAQAGCKAVDLPRVQPAVEALAIVPQRIARRHSLVPLRVSADGTAIAVAMTAPISADAIDAVSSVTGLAVVPYIADDDALEAALDRCYGGEERSEGDAPDEWLVTLPLAACINGV